MPIASFECDLDPETGAPRIRYNFANGWTASMLMRARDASLCDFTAASVAAWPTGQCIKKLAILGETEASADEAIAFLSAVALRPMIQ